VSESREDSTIVADEKSTHIVETFILGSLVKHHNADSLSVIKIGDTDYTYVGRTEDWHDKVGKVVAWVPPDSCVDTKRPEFTFLGDKSRVRARNIRGVNSYGVLVLAPEGIKPGENAALLLGVTHYDPETHQAEVKTNSKNAKAFALIPGEVASPPKGVFPKYDIDAFLKYAKKCFKDGETVYVTEKIHGSSSRFTFKDNEMYCGSRNEWKKEYSTAPNISLEDLTTKMDGNAEKAKEVYQRAVINFKPKKSMWWTLLASYPELRKYCEENPGYCVYGEIFGNVKNFRYGAADNQLLFRAFDILMPANPIPRWMDADDFITTCNKYGMPRVPLLTKMPYNFEDLIKMAEGNTTFPATHVREGVVVKPEKDRWSEFVGRVCFKIINPKYLEIN